MAYKFQLGSARLSGSIVLNEDLEVAGTTALANDQISAAELASDAVITVKIADANVTTAKLADSNVTTAKIADDAVTGAKIANGAIDLAHMSADSVDSDQYVDGSIDREHLSADIIDGTKIEDDAVNSEHIALGALDSEHYSSGSVENGHLANSTISGISLGSNLNSISAAADGAITFSPYNGSAAVSNVSVQVDGATIAKASNALKIADGGVDSLQIADDAVTGAKIAADAVDSEHIALGALDSEHYSTGSVENGHLAGNIANDKLANSAITLSAGAGMAALGAVSLGNSITVAVDGVLEDLDALGTASAAGEFIVATGAGAFAYESGDTARTSLGLGTGDSPTFAGLTVNGDLLVTGSLTYVNTTNLAISDALITIGSGSSAFAAGYGIEFGAMGDNWASLETATIGSDNVLSSSLPLAAPAVMANQFYGQLVGSFQMSVEALSSGDTMEVGKVYQVDNIASAGSFTIAMPSGASQGDVVRVKCKAVASGEKLTLTGGFDGGVNQIYLESDYAAVMFIYDGTEWMVF